MLLSVVIPTFNSFKYIGRCLASLQKQELDIGDELELIVVDGGSGDETVDRVKSFENVKLIHLQDEKLVSLRRQGVKIARGEVLVFVEADMELDENFIRNLIKPIKENRVKATFSREGLVANWQNFLARCWNWNKGLPLRKLYVNNFLNKKNYFMAILKTEVQDGVCLNELRYGVQFDGSVAFARKAIYFQYLPSTWFAVLQSASNEGVEFSTSLNFVKRIKLLLKFNFFVSLVLGLFNSFKYKEFMFLSFRIVYDFGFSLGVLKKTL